MRPTRYRLAVENLDDARAMTEAPIIPPLTVEFEVAAHPQHAFATWVERTDLWWPPGHTVSGAPAAIIFEPYAGGRRLRARRTGRRDPWGEVLVWEPPLRVEYLWHLFFAPDEATRVAVTFTPRNGATLVRLEQTGWDALGELGSIRREGTTQGGRSFAPTTDEWST